MFLLIAQMSNMMPFAIGGVVAIVLFVLVVSTLTAIVRVCPPNMVMVVTGAKTKVDGKNYGFRLQKGGWTTVIPYFQQVQLLDLSIIPINVRVEGVNSANGITVGADATACVCVDDEDPKLLYAAVERLMGKTRREIQEQIQQTMIGNFRGALNKATPLEAIGMVESCEKIDAGDLPGAPETKDAKEGERAQFRQELLRDSNEDLVCSACELFPFPCKRSGIHRITSPTSPINPCQESDRILKSKKRGCTPRQKAPSLIRQVANKSRRIVVMSEL